VFLKDIGRISGLLAVHFFVLLVQTLLERELRRAMIREKLESLPLYPEDRPCSRPTTIASSRSSNRSSDMCSASAMLSRSSW